MSASLPRLKKLCFAFALLAAPAFAQDGSEDAAARTPEAAQAFLSAHLQRGGWSVRSFDWYDGNVYRSHLKDAWQETVGRGTGGTYLLHGNIVGVSSPDPCTTIVRAAVGWKYRYFIDEASIPVEPKEIGARIDWRNVNSIEVKPSTKLSRQAGSPDVPTGGYEFAIWDPKSRAGITFVASDKIDAERAAFAMTFLKEKCDPTADSAF